MAGHRDDLEEDARKLRDYGIGTYIRNLLRHLARIIRIVNRLFRHGAEIVKLNAEVCQQRLQTLLLGVTSMIARERNSHVLQTFVWWC